MSKFQMALLAIVVGGMSAMAIAKTASPPATIDTSGQYTTNDDGFQVISPHNAQVAGSMANFDETAINTGGRVISPTTFTVEAGYVVAPFVAFIHGESDGRNTDRLNATSSTS